MYCTFDQCKLVLEISSFRVTILRGKWSVHINDSTLNYSVQINNHKFTSTLSVRGASRTLKSWETLEHTERKLFKLIKIEIEEAKWNMTSVRSVSKILPVVHQMVGIFCKCQICFKDLASCTPDGWNILGVRTKRRKSPKVLKVEYL